MRRILTTGPLGGQGHRQGAAWRAGRRDCGRPVKTGRGVCRVLDHPARQGGKGVVFWDVLPWQDGQGRHSVFIVVLVASTLPL